MEWYWFHQWWCFTITWSLPGPSTTCLPRFSVSIFSPPTYLPFFFFKLYTWPLQFFSLYSIWFYSFYEIYYHHVFFFFFFLFVGGSSLPWSNCEPEWSGEDCIEPIAAEECAERNNSYFKRQCLNSTQMTAMGLTMENITSAIRRPPAEEYFEYVNYFILKLIYQ